MVRPIYSHLTDIKIGQWSIDVNISYAIIVVSRDRRRMGLRRSTVGRRSVDPRSSFLSSRGGSRNLVVILDYLSLNFRHFKNIGDHG